MNENIPITDAHTHLWDPAEVRYDWLASVPALNQAFVLEDYDQATDGMNIERMVYVEPNPNPADNLKEVDWVESIAAKDPRMQGIVAYVDLTNPTQRDSDLENLLARPLVKGIRHNIQFNPEGFALQDSFVEGIKKVFAGDRHFELCLTYEQLPEVAELVKRLPEQTLIVDHCAKPGIKVGEIEEWKKGMKSLAGFPNVSCKVSGLLTEADCENWTPEQILPYLNHVLDCFGTERILFGGDWPVSILAGGYSAWYDLISNWTSTWSDTDQLKFYHENAGKLYRL